MSLEFERLIVDSKSYDGPIDCLMEIVDCSIVVRLQQ